jgi:hypothetical protein
MLQDYSWLGAVEVVKLRRWVTCNFMQILKRSILIRVAGYPGKKLPVDSAVTLAIYNGIRAIQGRYRQND